MAIQSSTEIQPAIDQLLEQNKKIGKASHPAMYAWKTAASNEIKIKRKPRKVTKSTIQQMCILHELDHFNQGSNDCGEGGSGNRLMGLLDRLHIVNVLVVVTRWYGGVHLGPSRFRCISDVAMESLVNAGYTELKAPKNCWIDIYKLQQYKCR